MWKKLRWYLPMALAGLLLLALACQSTTETPGGQVATPDAQATITAMAQRPNFSTPTPTVVPPGAMEAAEEFFQGFQAANQKWDRLHLDYDTWQAGLLACDAGSMRASLGQFAGRFAAITQSARELTRAGATREFANRIIHAAEVEEQALRSLRDNWQPGGSVIAAIEATEEEDGSSVGEEEATNGSEISNNPGPVSVFEQVDQARSSATDILQEVTDTLTDLDERATEAGRAMLEDFTLAFHAANVRWDTFHQEYDAFRAEEVDLTLSQIAAQLSGLVSQFSQVVLVIRELPKSDDTHSVANIMAQTVDAEDLALRKLRATFQKVGPGDGNSGNGTADGDDLIALDPNLFESYEAQLVASNTSRRHASEAMAELNLSLSEDQLGVVAEFNRQYQGLLSDWDEFHLDYNLWRVGEGGCNREDAIKILADLGARFNQLAADVGDFPNTTVLRPMGELLVEAVRREASSLMDLRDQWRPFDAGIYQPLRQERVVADKLRRQVAVGIQDLLEQYGINPT